MWRAEAAPAEKNHKNHNKICVEKIITRVKDNKK